MKAIAPIMTCALTMTCTLVLAAEDANGQGAFRAGATLSVSGQSGTVLLERLRALETELAAARAELDARDRVLAEQKRALEEERGRSEALTGKVQYLDHARISLENARQEVGDRGKRIEMLDLQLAQSELARLRAERFLFDIAGDLLAIDVGDAAALSAIQAKLRVRVASMERTDIKDTQDTQGAKP